MLVEATFALELVADRQRLGEVTGDLRHSTAANASSW